MGAKNLIVAVIITVAVVVGYTAHVRSMGKLEGEIRARGESIKQLSQLAAKTDAHYKYGKLWFVRSRAKYQMTRDSVLKSGPLVPGVGTLIRTADSAIASCTLGLSACDQRDSVRLAQIAALNQQIGAYQKLHKKSKLFGFLPRPTLQVGACVDQRLKPSLCLSGGFPITK